MVLDDIQKQIVACDEPNILVVAGAGSGKTRVLTERVKRLISDGVDPCNLVVITFTNMEQMKMRERLTDVEGIGDAFIGTIHSFANKLMFNSAEVYEIYNEETENKYTRLIIRRYCKHLTYDKFLEYKDLKYAAEMGKIDEESVTEFLLPSERADLSSIFGEPDEVFKQTISSVCKAEGVITFNELLKKATDYFKSLGARVEHVLVDELQDIGYLEYSFIKGLNALNYFYVGDDWQAIYGFKGGDINIFLNLIKNKDFKTFYLSINYRCKASIIKKSNLVIQQLDEADIIKKNVTAFTKKEGEVIVASKFKLVYYLKDIKPKDYKNYFLLVRTNKQLFEVLQILESLNIPVSCFKKGELSLEEMREELERDSIKLLTVHTSKGLESKNVILYGNFPLKQPSYIQNNDERKVMYVGMTRAIDKLIILN